MYCTYCGAPNPENASFCSSCGKAVALPPVQATASSMPQPRPVPQVATVAEPAQPVSASPAAAAAAPKPHSHMLRNVTMIAAALAAVVVAVILLSGPSPKDSLQKAGAALAQQNAQQFDTYVDVQSVLDDWTDQVAAGWLVSNQNSAANAFVATGLVVGFKTLMVPKLASSVEQELLANGTSEQPQSSDSDAASNYIAGFLSSGIHTLITSQLTYQGVASETKSGSNAVLDVRVGSPLSASSFIVQVKMQQAGDHWRVVAIPNMAGLLAQLHPAQ